MIVCSDSTDILDLQDKLDRNTQRLYSISKELKKDLGALYTYSYNLERSQRLQNPYIVKSVIKYMAKGINQQDAFILTATDFHTNVKRVESVFWGQKRYTAAINPFAKRYLCEKLKKSGMTAKQIAKIIGVSENHIFKLLRVNVDFWFLK